MLLESGKTLILALAEGVEYGAAVVITAAVIQATIRSVVLFVRGDVAAVNSQVRLRLGRWLTVALEFLVAADILRTAVAPTWNDIGKLAATAALRTILNYFLEQEIRLDAQSRRPA